MLERARELWNRSKTPAQSARCHFAIGCGEFLLSIRLYGIDLPGDFVGQGFDAGMKEPAFPLGQFVQQIGNGVISQPGNAAQPAVSAMAHTKVNLRW